MQWKGQMSQTAGYVTLTWKNALKNEPHSMLYFVNK